jgi:hypothetical protein
MIAEWMATFTPITPLLESLCPLLSTANGQLESFIAVGAAAVRAALRHGWEADEGEGMEGRTRKDTKNTTYTNIENSNTEFDEPWRNRLRASVGALALLLLTDFETEQESEEDKETERTGKANWSDGNERSSTNEV